MARANAKRVWIGLVDPRSYGVTQIESKSKLAIERPKELLQRLSEKKLSESSGFLHCFYAVLISGITGRILNVSGSVAVKNQKSSTAFSTFTYSLKSAGLVI
jgi:hypothetical protein